MQAIAAQVASSPREVVRTTTILGALAGRLLTRGGLAVASRDAGGETLFTGRSRPYSEAWLRQEAERIELAGGAVACSEQVFAQVTTAARGHVLTAFTDMFDQVWWTKLPAHAGPIGRLANRCLGAVYFGVTTVHIALDTAPGLTLGLHLSAHKPATPLHDAIEDLVDDEARLSWLQSVRHFVVDRGGNGKRTLLFMREARLPYLTMAQRSTELPAVADATDFTDSGLPLRVTPDLAVAGDVAPSPGEPGPRRIVFPANPDRGAACEKAIEYLVDATLSTDELRNLDAVYKGRWGSGENVLKALQAVGFGVNRSRRIELACSRGDDGKLARSEARYEELADTLKSINHRGSPKEARHFDRTLVKIGAETLKAQQIRDKPSTKHVRVVDGTGEMLVKWLMLLLTNALAIMLGRSRIPAVRTMTPAHLNGLLLGRSTVASIGAKTITLYLEPIHEYRDREHQRELVRVFDEAALRLTGRTLRLRLRKARGAE